MKHANRQLYESSGRVMLNQKTHNLREELAQGGKLSDKARKVEAQAVPLFKKFTGLRGDLMNAGQKWRLLRERMERQQLDMSLIHEIEQETLADPGSYSAELTDKVNDEETAIKELNQRLDQVTDQLSHYYLEVRRLKKEDKSDQLKRLRVQIRNSTDALLAKEMELQRWAIEIQNLRAENQTLKQVNGFLSLENERLKETALKTKNQLKDSNLDINQKSSVIAVLSTQLQFLRDKVEHGKKPKVPLERLQIWESSYLTVEDREIELSDSRHNPNISDNSYRPYRKN